MTVAHSRTRDLPDVVRRADIVVAAVGRPEMIRGDWIKPGAMVIDVGINRMPADDGKRGWSAMSISTKRVGTRLAITPVPGGVGPDDHRHAIEEYPRRRAPPCRASLIRRVCDMLDLVACRCHFATAVDAERAFARDAKRIGQWTAFRKYADETRGDVHAAGGLGARVPRRIARTRPSPVRLVAGGRARSPATDGPRSTRGPWSPRRRQVRRLLHHRVACAKSGSGNGSMTAATSSGRAEPLPKQARSIAQGVVPRQADPRRRIASTCRQRRPAARGKAPPSDMAGPLGGRDAGLGLEGRAPTARGISALTLWNGALRAVVHDQIAASEYARK